MHENIVENLIARIKKEVITDDKMQEIPLGYLITRKIPESVKHFFNQEVEIWIREEEEKFNSSDKFDYDMPEVRMLIDQMFDLLKQNSRFHITKFNLLLERAVKLEMNYLIEPHRTLSQFIFKNGQIVSTMEVYDTLKYFFKYDYYKTAISDYFNSKYLHEISQEQFNELIAKIDENAFKNDRFETTLKTIKAIAGFISEAVDKEIDVLEVDTLAHAFKDRNLESYTELTEKLKKNKKEEITFSELEKMLKDENIDFLEPKAEAKKETPTAEEKAKVEEQLKIEEIADIEKSKPEVEVTDIEIGEMKVEAVEEEDEEEEDEEEIEEVVVTAKPAPAKKGNVADDLANFVAGQIKSDEPMQDLNTMIAGRNRKKIIKKLFKKNERDFLSFIQTINAQSAWKEASVIIDEEFYQRGINPYSKEAIMFSDIIYTRFFPKDKFVSEQIH